jgi:hypothetical protein
MVFIGIVLIAVLLYVRGFKIPALLLFFFFITSGFNLVPEKMMDLKIFSKGMDYAILILISMVIIDSFCIKNYLKPDKLLWFIFTFYGFLAICVIYNKYIIGVGWKDIIRTARYNVLWIAYLVFRNLPKERLLLLLKCLFLITVGCSILFLLQIVLDEFILNKAMKVYISGFGMKIPRFYNQPDMLQIFTFMAIYFNPYKGQVKIITTIILITTLLGAFHRSLFVAFIMAISVGYIIRLSQTKKIVVLTSISILSLFVIIFLGYKFVNSRTIKDIAIVTSGNAADAYSSDVIDIEDLQKSTFTFRIAHLLERNQYLLEHPKAMLLGAGLMAEDSKLTDVMFDFNVGLVEKSLGKTVQLDTGDISYSILILRYGYAGTLIALSLYVFFMYYFYKNRDNPVGLFSFVCFIVVIIISFFSYILTLPVTFLLPLISYSVIQKNNNEHE